MENTTPKGNESEKMNMADRFMTAMFLPKEYNKLLRLSAGKLVQFLAVLILLVTVIQYAIPALGALAGMGGVKNIILNEIPEFSLENGTFFLDEKIEKTDETSGIYVIVDTSVDKYTKEDVPKNMIQAILISKSNILVYNQMAGLGGMVQENKFEDLQGITINNQTVADQSVMIYVSLFFLFIFFYFVEIVKYLGAGLFYGFFMYLLTKTMMLENTTFGQVYKIAMYAQSIGAVVNAVMCCINIPILVMAGSSFAMLITVMIMNRVLLQIKMQSEHL